MASSILGHHGLRAEGLGSKLIHLRVRRISLTADAPSFKVKVPRTSRAGVNETLTGEQVAARLVSVMRSRAHRGKTMDEWRKEQLAWLLDPVRPAKKG